MRNDYNSVAKKKIKTLKEREDFIKVVIENEFYTKIEFEHSLCKVTSLGSVSWGEKYE